MSHFTHIKTRFQNLFYLEKTLNRLNVTHRREEEKISSLNSSHIKLVIPQSNGYDINFCWNGQEYDLVADISFWDQKYPTKELLDRLAQQYAGEVVIGESEKIGFQPIKYQDNSDGSKTIVLERWSE